MGAQAIPQKLYYRIGKVAEIAGVKPHVLRYWETEFGFLSPQKNEGNQRLYTPKDLEKVMLIRKLLYEDRFTIAGAKRKLREERKTAGAAMRNVRTHLVRVRRLAREHPGRLAASVIEHHLIAQAIADGDADLAAHATHVHLHHALSHVIASPRTQQGAA